MMTELAMQKPTFDNVEVEKRNGDNSNLERGFVSRPYDSTSPLGDFSKRYFDRIGGYSSLGGLQKRAFDRISDLSSLGGLSKKSSSSVNEGPPSSVQFEERVQRAFDRIGGMSAFGGFNKKAAE